MKGQLTAPKFMIKTKTYQSGNKYIIKDVKIDAKHHGISKTTSKTIIIIG